MRSLVPFTPPLTLSSVLKHHPHPTDVIIGTPTGIYATFVLTVVMEEDMSRVLWPSCPSNGWKAGVHRLDAHPDGSPLGLLPNARPPTAILGQRGVITADGGSAIVSGRSSKDASALPGAQSCTYTQDMDVGDAGGTSKPGVTPQDCCPLCYSDAQCTSVVWYQGACGDSSPRLLLF